MMKCLLISTVFRRALTDISSDASCRSSRLLERKIHHEDRYHASDHVLGEAENRDERRSDGPGIRNAGTGLAGSTISGGTPGEPLNSSCLEKLKDRHSSEQKSELQAMSSLVYITKSILDHLEQQSIPMSIRTRNAPILSNK